MKTTQVEPAMKIRELVEPAVAKQGLSLYDIELSSGVLRVTVDKEGGVDVDGVGEASQEISRILDDNDPVPGSQYLLEVSSPGVERNLRVPQHFVAAVGERAKMRLERSYEGERRIEGVIVAADETGIDIAANGEESPSVHIAYESIEQARTVFDWSNAFSGAQQDRKSTEKKA